MGSNWMIFAAAVLPVVLLLLRIYLKDKMEREPARLLIKAFIFGCLTPFASGFISIPLGSAGFFPEAVQSLGDALRISFYGAAIPEEIAKLLFLWLLLRRCSYFDEHMDGIVYAVFVSLGFAAVENCMYLFGSGDEWLSVGVSRGLFSVPGHMGFGILMGYYYSLARFSQERRALHRILALVAPILAHGIYDSLLFMQEVPALAGGLLTLLFIWFCYKLWKRGSQSIAAHLERDAAAQKAMAEPIGDTENTL